MNLLHLFRIYPLDLDAVARALVDDLLDDFEPSELEPNMARQFLRTRYMRAAAKYALPVSAVDDVADRAWSLIAAAQHLPLLPEAAFSFYE